MLNSKKKEPQEVPVDPASVKRYTTTIHYYGYNGRPEQIFCTTTSCRIIDSMFVATDEFEDITYTVPVARIYNTVTSPIK